MSTDSKYLLTLNNLIWRNIVVYAGQANKRCLDNSTWYVGAVGLEWTNYDSCYVVSNLTTSYITLMRQCNLPSVVLTLFLPQWEKEEEEKMV